MTSISEPSQPWLPYHVSRRDERMVGVWLFVVSAFVLAMVLVGGLTRLTDSGLSITEWKPLLGAIPPLNSADWAEAFLKYKQIPEYQIVNKGMSLEEFKFIYWWEWGHRFLGRIVGFVFLLPFIFFVATRRLTRDFIVPVSALFLFGGMQGFMGWYMVQSGLSERVDVSQYRLAAHFGLALIIFSWSFWLGLSHWKGTAIRPETGRQVSFAGMLTLFIFLQCLLGALVAGTKAGLSYNTWPLMDGDFIPDGLIEPGTSILINVLENLTTIQFNHRMTAYILLALVLFEFVRRYRTAPGSAETKSARNLFAIVCLQAGVGIATLLYMVPISLGALHQVMAVIVLGFGVFHLHRLRFPIRVSYNIE